MASIRAGASWRVGDLRIEQKVSMQLMSTANHPPMECSAGRCGLFAPAQPIEVMAGVSLTVRRSKFQLAKRVMREIVRAEGPERISGDWLTA